MADGGAISERGIGSNVRGDGQRRRRVGWASRAAAKQEQYQRKKDETQRHKLGSFRRRCTQTHCRPRARSSLRISKRSIADCGGKRFSILEANGESRIQLSNSSSSNHGGRFATNTKITKIFLVFLFFVMAVRPSWFERHN